MAATQALWRRPAAQLGALVLALLAAMVLAQSRASAARPDAHAPMTQSKPWARYSVEMRLEPGRGVADALQARGVTPADAGRAVGILSESFDTVNFPAGLRVGLVLARRDGAVRLQKLTVTTGGGRTVVERATADGFAVDPPVEPLDPAEPPALSAAPVVVLGDVQSLLYGGEAGRGAPQAVVGQALRLFSRDLNLNSEVALDSPVRLVFDGTQAQSLIYAQIDGLRGSVRFYRLASNERGETGYRYVDGAGSDGADQLLRTPVANPRVTSAFGMRMHPLLGFSRMHSGVDFGAPEGSPVLAAAAGVVQEVGWRGGYGRWIKLSHSPAVATGYGHLSAWAPGMAAGVRVSQGQVIGYVGHSGLATGPHLHFEVFEGGVRIDPQSAGRLQVASRPSPQVLEQERRIDALLAIRGGGSAG